MPTRTPPVHTTAPTPAYPGHYPRPWLLGRSHLMTWRTADHLLAEIWPREPGWGFSVPAGRWSVTVGPCCPPSPHRGAYHGRRSPWPLGPCPFGPSLSAHFGWSVLTTVQKHVRNEMDPLLRGSTAMSPNEFQSREPIEPQEASPMKHEINVLGSDIAKHVFHAVGMDDRGNIVYRKRLSRHDLMPFIAKLPPVRIGIEACGGAHYWARRFRAYGHEVKLMAPQVVKPYVKSNKNDSRDAEAIAEAVTRPTMRFVPIKDVDQQDLQALHRVRERLMGERTALVNEVHGLLHEYGIVMPKGVSKFRQAVVGKLEADKDKLT